MWKGIQSRRNFINSFSKAQEMKMNKMVSSKSKKVDEITRTINIIKSKGRTMESGTIIADGRYWVYKIKYQRPKNKKEWTEAFTNRKRDDYFPDNTKHKPTDPLGRCDLCQAPIYEETEPEQEGYCWNCGVKFV